MLWSSRPPGGWVSAEYGSCKKHRCCVLSGYIISNCCATPWTIADRLLCPWHSPGKNPGVSCHFLLQGIFVTQVSPPLANGFLTTAPPGKPRTQILVGLLVISQHPLILCEISDSPRGLRCPRAQASALPSVFLAGNIRGSQAASLFPPHSPTSPPWLLKGAQLRAFPRLLGSIQRHQTKGGSDSSKLSGFLHRAI